MKSRLTLMAIVCIAAIALFHVNYSDKREKKAIMITNGSSTTSNDFANSNNNETSFKKGLYKSKLLEKKGAVSLHNITNTFNSCTNPPNDPGFPLQWGLYNAQSPTLDIDICEAWQESEGQGITVAVIDNGINFLQSDLAPNLLPDSYNTVNPSQPSEYISGFTHGTHVAGVIAAVKNNGDQLVGVAPKSKIMGISSSLNTQDPELISQLADGINWAVEKEVDVINLSWGFDPGDPGQSNSYGPAIINAINNAIANGVVIVFAAGNRGVIDYPGNANSKMIVVGSITSTGTRVNGQSNNISGTGPGLDVVAPGLGYPLLDSNSLSGGGTSFAAPHVAGIAALMLSVNPDLTVDQVHDIINNTAHQLSSYNYDANGWNAEVGHGLVNAHDAVLEAKRLKNPLKISEDIDLICSNSNYTFTINNHIDNVTWQVSNNLDIISSNNHEIVVKGKSNTLTAGGYGFVKATIGTQTDTTNFWVGTPQPGIIHFSNYFGDTSHLCSSHNNNAYSFTTSPSSIDYHQARLLSFPSMNVLYTSPIRFGKTGTINYPATPGWYVLEVSLTNACGTSDWVGQEVQYINCSSGGGSGPGGGEGGEGGDFGRNTDNFNDQPIIEKEFGFDIYPNPSSSILIIKRKHAIQRNSFKPSSQTYALYDMSGKLIKKGILKEKNDINVANVQSGKYILKLYAQQKEETHHIIIE